MFVCVEGVDLEAAREQAGGEGGCSRRDDEEAEVPVYLCVPHQDAV